ncbi:MAG: hypothetical protein F6K30_13300 [Cyanothece sp. SIO2G6]|nr:hypothetical protein [Cyanothece sp. SIO2G6]
MILSRRKTHFYASIALAVTLPIVFFAGLFWRPGTPIVDGTANQSLEELFAIAQFPTTTSTLDNADILSEGAIQLRAIATEANGQPVLELQPVTAIQAADILVYWQPGSAATEPAPEPATEPAPEPAREPATENTNPISETAVLLGQLAGDRPRRFPLPANLPGQTGSLILYSNGQNAVLATFPLDL